MDCCGVYVAAIVGNEISIVEERFEVKYLLWIVIALSVCLVYPRAGAVTLAQQSQRKPCSSLEYREFDFWIGDWDTFEVTDPKKVVARNRVEPMLGGCAIREVYAQNDGLIGESFSIYDSARNVWHQSWSRIAASF